MKTLMMICRRTLASASGEKPTRRHPLVALGFVILGAALTAALVQAIPVNAIHDYLKVTGLSNPVSGFARVYVDSGTNQLACLNSDGSSCAPAGGTGATVSGEIVTYSGSTYAPVYPSTVRAAATFTQIGFGVGDTLTDVDGVPTLFVASATAGSLRAAVITAAIPYTVVLGADISIINTNSQDAGLVVRESGTGELETVGLNLNNGVSAFQWNSTSSKGSSIWDFGFIPWRSQRVYYAIRHLTGQARTFYVCATTNFNSCTAFTNQADGTFLTEDQVGFYLTTNPDTPGVLSAFSLTVN